MSRLPVPGKDNNVWGAVLNDFLSQSLNSNGTIKSSSLSSAGVEMASNKGKAGGYASLDNTGKVPSGNLPASGSVANATSSSPGLIQLAGDLSGTATHPTVNGLSSKYTLPNGGIPASDLSSTVNGYLTGAQTAVQSVNGKTGSSVSLNLDDMANVSTGGITNGETLIRSGSGWTPGSFISNSELGAANGVATLDNNSRLTVSQLPTGVGDGRIIQSTLFIGNHTLALGDAGMCLEFYGSWTLTIPPDSSVAFPIGTVIEVYGLGTSMVTFAVGSGAVLIRSDGGLMHLNNFGGAEATARLRHRDVNEWVLTGDLS